MLKSFIAIITSIIFLVSCSMTNMGELDLAAAATNTNTTQEANIFKNAVLSPQSFKASQKHSAEMVNLAQGKTVLASSIYSPDYQAAKAVDANTTTAWASSMSGTNQWIYVDLGELSTVNAVAINWYDKYFATTYSIYVSNDGTNWAKVYTKTNGTGGYEELTGEGNCRYVGFYFTAKNDAAYAISEIEVKTSSIVKFQNINLEKVVREAIKRPTGVLFPFHLDPITELNAGKKSIFELGGIEYCRNLEVLDLSSNNLISLTPLEQLRSLRVLNANYNKLTNIASLERMNGLEMLGISGNKVSDITLLRNKILLTYLDISYNEISDLTPITQSVKIKTLLMNNNSISNIDVIGNFSELLTLNADNNTIINIDALALTTQLEALTLNNNQITDLYGVSNLHRLHKLHVISNNITSLSAVSNLVSLTSLRADDNNITSIDGIQNLALIRGIHLQSNQITDIGPLAYLTHVTGIHLNNNNISDLTPISNLKYVHTLQVQNNNISDLSPVNTMLGLKSLEAASNNITSLSTLRNPGKLTNLNLAKNMIKDLTPLLDTFQILPFFDFTYNNMVIKDDGGGQGSKNLEVIRKYYLPSNYPRWEAGNITQ